MPDLTIQPDEIEWRVGATYDGRDGKMGMLLGYIDARLAMEKLDALDEHWSSHIEVIRLSEKDGIRCSLTVNGVTREDVGTASETEPLKGAVSDALKRAAVHFGIGRELYDLPAIGVQCEVKANGKAGKPKALPVWKKDRWTIDPKLGWVRYDHEPIEQAGSVSRPAARGADAPPPSTSPPAPAQYRRQELAELAGEKQLDSDALGFYADLIGIAKGERATDEQMDRLLEAVRGHGSEEQIVLPHIDPPMPGTDDYLALPATEKAQAKAYWAKQEVTA